MEMKEIVYESFSCDELHSHIESVKRHLGVLPTEVLDDVEGLILFLTE